MKMRAAAWTVLVALLGSLTGCYNTYQVAPDEFRKLQSRTALREDSRLADKITPEELTALTSLGEQDTVTVNSTENEKVGVNRDTKLFVRSQGGRRYEVTPFNFSMVSSQLVASDRDTLVPLSDLASFEIDHLSTPKTVAMISLAVVGAASVIAVIFAVSGSKSQSE
jgi:hypothetical protein